MGYKFVELTLILSYDNILFQMLPKNASNNNFLEVLKKTSLKMSQFIIFGKFAGRLTVVDPSKPERQQKRHGNYFVKLPKDLAEILPGSELGPKIF